MYTETIALLHWYPVGATVGIFLTLTLPYEVSGVPVITPFARRVWQNRILLEMSGRRMRRPDLIVVQQILSWT